MIRRIWVEIIFIIIIFSPMIFLAELMGLKPISLGAGPLVVMATIYIVTRISQILLKQYRDRNEDIENEQRIRRDLY